MSYVPDRGDAIWLQFNPQAGHEQAGHRPAIVLSAAVYNRRTRMAIVCPITSQSKGYPFEVQLPDELPIAGVVLSDQVKNLDWYMRDANLICTLPDVVLHEVVEKLETLLRW